MRYDLFYTDIPQFRQPVWDSDDVERILRAERISPEHIQKAPARGYLSPRIRGIFALGDNQRFYFGFGRYAHLPAFRDAFLNPGTIFNRLFVNISQFYALDFRAIDPTPIRTTQFSMGLSHRAGPYFRSGLTVFHKRADGQLEAARWYHPYTVTFFIPRDDPFNIVLDNRGRMVITGVELNLTYSRPVVCFWATYSYNFARSSSSYLLSNLGFQIWKRPGTELPLLKTEYVPLHQLQAYFHLRLSEFQRNNFSHTSATVLFRFNAGHPAVLYKTFSTMGGKPLSIGRILSDSDQRDRLGIYDIVSTPINYQLDLRLGKSIILSGIHFKGYVYIQNLLNRKDVIHVYRTTGKADDDGYRQFLLYYTPYLSDPPLAERLYREINLTHRQHYAMQQGGDLFGRPREVRLGIQLEILP